MRRAFCCWSGGKESSLSFYKAQLSGIKILFLLNMLSEDGRRSRSHGIDAECLRQQSRAMGVPIIQRETSWENYEQQFKHEVSGLKEKSVETGIFGDIDLEGHREWVERICRELRIEPVLPLWQEKREQILEEFIATGFKAIVVATQAAHLGQEWLGRQIDREFVKDLQARDDIDLCGERGEYHTFVFDGPIFARPVVFTPGAKILKDDHWFLEMIPGRE
jgi:uncharacterized protein (TIGR00290 family)